jgi:hypothetical protein
VSRLKIGLAALTVAVVLTVTITASAMGAGSWFVQGTKVASGATLAIAIPDQVQEDGVLAVPSIGIELTCSSGASAGAAKPFIQGPDAGGAESIVFEGCSEIEPSGCTISTEFATFPVKTTLETSTSPSDLLRFAPATKNTFAELTFNGVCALAGEKLIRGQLALRAPTGQSELVAHTIVSLGTTENNSLEVGGIKAYLEASSALLSLASGVAWSFH